MSKAEKDIKEIFHELYSYNELFGKHTTNKSLQKKLERFRDNMAVDFYNIEWKNNDQVKEFLDRYIYVSSNLDNLYKADDISIGVVEGTSKRNTTRHLLRGEQQYFRAITDKILAGKKLTEEQLKNINYHLLYTFKQVKCLDDCYKIEQSSNVPDEIYKALYEWVIFLSRGLVKVKRCEECGRLYIPTARGHDQKYCKNSCKMKSFRRLNKKIVTR